MYSYWLYVLLLEEGGLYIRTTDLKCDAMILYVKHFQFPLLSTSIGKITPPSKGGGCHKGEEALIYMETLCSRLTLSYLYQDY